MTINPFVEQSSRDGFGRGIDRYHDSTIRTVSHRDNPVDGRDERVDIVRRSSLDTNPDWEHTRRRKFPPLSCSWWWWNLVVVIAVIITTTTTSPAPIARSGT